MTAPTPPAPTDDPLKALREGIDAHRQLTDAVEAAAADERRQPAPTAPAPTEAPA